RVKGACRVALQSRITERSILVAVTVQEGVGAMSVVAGPADVVKERKGADCVIVRATVVKDKRVGSNSYVLRAAGVEQHGYSADCGIGIRGVEDQRASANSGVETAVGIAKERVPTKARISSAGGEEVKRIA